MNYRDSRNFCLFPFFYFFLFFLNVVAWLLKQTFNCLTSSQAIGDCSVFSRKRDRIQIIADILCSCLRPQTQSYIRRQTTISYTVIQTCINESVLKHWLAPIEEKDGQNKLAITTKGLIFLDKWIELQKLVKTKNGSQLKVLSQEIHTIIVS